jgi:Flp pilus assembly protein TadD
MASKESMVIAPLIVVLYDRAFEFDSWGQAIVGRKYLYAGLATTWLVLGALVWQQPRSTAGLSTPVDSWTYLLNQASMVTRYLRLVIWPQALVLDYGLPSKLSILDVIPSALVVVSLLAAAGVSLVRWPRVGFLAAAFFLTLAPTSSVIPISSEVGAERRMYLPMAALATLVAIGGRSLLDRFQADPVGRARVQATAIALVAIVLAALALRTVNRNADYATPLTLWRTVVENRPQGRARMALAAELVSAGQHDEALALLREAVRDYPDARFALGTELIAGGKIEEGVTELTAFIADKPSNPNRIPGRTLLGEALASKGKLAEASEQFRAVLALLPSSDGVRAKLADVLFAQGKVDEAMAEYRTLLASQPENPAIETKLATNLMGLGRPGEAVEHFQKALQLEPGSPTTNRSLAEAYLRLGDVSLGERYAREALRLAPGDASAHNVLGIALASRGSLDEAAASFRQALQIDPNDRQVQANLERALRIMASRSTMRPAR